MNSFSLFATLIAAICAGSSSAAETNLLTANQCNPAPLNTIQTINPCVCDCRYEHNATNGLCNQKSMCVCYYDGEPEAAIPPVLPAIGAGCPVPVIQCYSDVNPQAKAGFEVGCNLDCMCTHGAPTGGTCDFKIQKCFCNYTNVDKNTTDNAGCPDAFKGQLGFFLRGFLTQAKQCADSPLANGLLSPACNSLLTYPVLLPGADITKCFSGASLNTLTAAEIKKCVDGVSLTTLQTYLKGSVLEYLIPKFKLGNFNTY